MFVFFAGGTYIMSFFGITIDGIRIAGGLIVSRIGFGLLTPKENRSVDADGPGASPKEDISFCPLALPLIAGPGALAVVLAASAKIETFAWSPYISITMAILATSLLSWLCLRFSVRLLHFMGVTGMNAITRIMGFLLICIAIQMIITGTENLMYQWGFIAPGVHEHICTITKHFAF
jgi:multiple antibiotic resistance protein